MTKRIVILTEGHTDPVTAKTAASVVRYRTDEVVAILDGAQAGRTCRELLEVGGPIPVVGSLADVPEADTLLIGIAPSGGRIPEAWRPIVLEAISRGMDVLSGLHDFLGDDAEFAEAARRRGVQLVDVRKSRQHDVAHCRGLREECLRIHTVGNDCGVGKMVVAIELARALQRAGRDAKFVATGQTGILIEGDGCAVDCVVADFVSGAAENLVLAHQHHEILVIEGQGSLAHPKYSGVTLGLLHGCAPHGMVLCYEAGRKTIGGMGGIELPSPDRTRRLYETMAALRHPSKVIGVAISGRRLSDEEAAAERARVQDELGLPACDVFRDGPDELVEAALRLQADLCGFG